MQCYLSKFSLLLMMCGASVMFGSPLTHYKIILKIKLIINNDTKCVHICTLAFMSSCFCF